MSPADRADAGKSPNQFTNRIKMKMVAKNQKVFFTKSVADHALEKIVETLHHPFPKILQARRDRLDLPRRELRQQDNPGRDEPSHDHRVRDNELPSLKSSSGLRGRLMFLRGRVFGSCHGLMRRLLRKSRCSDRAQKSDRQQQN